MLITAFAVGSCSDDLEQPERDVDFCVRAAWQNGLVSDRGTRAMTATDILTSGTSDIIISTEDYPDEIHVECNGKNFTLTKASPLTECATHTGFYNGYTSGYALKDIEVKKGVTATATIDGGDVLYSSTSDVELDGTHLKFTLHHSKALLRFAFKVSEKYDKLRVVKVTGISLNGNSCYVKDAVLAEDKLTYIAYAYVDPSAVTTSSTNTIACTYNIYDRDDATADHLTREGVTATNTFRLSTLKDAHDNTVSEIRAGYYYDLKVTLDPTYLYVMAEHDNKHITIE